MPENWLMFHQLYERAPTKAHALEFRVILLNNARRRATGLANLRPPFMQNFFSGTEFRSSRG
jgi:hypothetical protein